MPLTHELISQFVKVTNDKKTETRKETTAYGTVVTQNNIKYVKLDGSDELTPVNTNVVIHENDRVMVLIKNHTATVTGNESRKANQSSTKNNNNEYITLDDLAEGQVTRAEFDDLYAAHLEVQGKLEAEDGIIKTLESNSAYIKELSSDKGIIASLRAEDVKINENLTANTAYIETLSAEDGIIANLQAKDVEIEGNLTSHIADFDILDADVAEFKIATADNFTSVNAKIEKLETDSLTSTNASITYAKIDFSNIGEAAVEKLFSDSGIIKELVMSEGHVTGSLQGVTINGDLIEANTLRTNKLVVKGTDGNYYSLNVNFDGIEGVTVASDDQIHGSALVADSVTANKIRVDDLVAFEATVGGFQLTENSIYSGSKGSASSDIPGLYFDSDGQMAVGDESKYIKFYDDNGVKKLLISADSIKLGSGKDLSNVSGEISDATERIAVAESLISQLSTAISMLVTDENGMSLMTQTDDGWTFSTAQIQDAISDMSANLSTLTDTMGDVGMTIDVLSQAVADLGEIAEYVYITTYEDEPCIELGEGDSEFKLRITNTRMMFTEGSTVLAYFNNQSLHAKKVVIEEELQQGGFVRTTRSNGHLSLVWKGVES